MFQLNVRFITHAFYITGSGPVGQGQSAIKLQVKRELEAERKAAENARKLAETYAPPKEVSRVGVPMLAVSGVYYKCPMVGPQVLPRKEMQSLIEEFLWSQLGEEPEMTSALMIHTMNKDPDKVKTCIETLCKYLDNIISNPTEEKFHKIRLNNKAFQERISPLSGTEEFLQAAGFHIKQLPGPNDGNENFYVMDPEFAKDSDRLKSIKEVLFVAEPIRPELDRGLKVFYPSSQASRMELPNEFYSKTPEELKKEQQLKTEAVEKLGMLRTKEMREREQLRELRKYRFTLIRVRFPPDGIILQGTFRATEKLSALYQYIRENLKNDWMPFNLSAQGGAPLKDEDLTLAELGLVPAAVVNFSWDAEVMQEVAAQKGTAQSPQCLDDEIMSRIESL